MEPRAAGCAPGGGFASGKRASATIDKSKKAKREAKST
jgi:hypothetical protein